jgi:hypothetical protein
MRALARSERGNVIVVAMFVLAIMLAIGVAAMSQVDTQSDQSRRERVGESSFNYAEAALSAQIFILGRRGTGTETNPYPAVCPTAGNDFCADPAQVVRNYDQATHKDFDPTQIAWRTWVRDNAPSAGAPDTFWEDGLLTTRPLYDQNADRLMWVRAQASVRERTRAMVGLIKIEDKPVNFPSYAILGGKFRTTNDGIHSDAIVDASNSLGVQVRCSGSIPSTNCMDYEPSQRQIVPADLVSTGYSGEATAVNTDDLDSLMDVARANGTYYAGCPGSLSGAVVVIDTTLLCTYQSNAQYNATNDPGLVILTRGKLELRGTVTYHGLIYHANLGPSSDWLVKVHGNSQVNGGVLVDGDGGIEAGSSGKQNLKFNANAFENITSFGTAGVVQNTWREIQPLAG